MILTRGFCMLIVVIKVLTSLEIKSESRRQEN
jgi:hypothetical protein